MKELEGNEQDEMIAALLKRPWKLRLRWKLERVQSIARRVLRIAWRRLRLQPIFRHTKAMGEISGFGAGYEATCQDMLEAGVLWLLSNPDRRDIKIGEYEGIYGVALIEGADGKELEQVVLRAAGGDCTGAMMHAVMRRLSYIRDHGWERYRSTLDGD